MTRTTHVSDSQR